MKVGTEEGDGHLILRAKHSNSEELPPSLTLPKEMCKWKEVVERKAVQKHL